MFERVVILCICKDISDFGLCLNGLLKYPVSLVEDLLLFPAESEALFALYPPELVYARQSSLKS